MRSPIKGVFALYVIVSVEVSFRIIESARLTALSQTEHVLHLYQQIRTEDAPARTDPAITRARIRKQICKDIIRSGYFDWYYIRAEILDMINSRYYQQIFQAIFTPTESQENPFKYTNPFTRREINYNDLHRFTEYVFVCPMKNSFNNRIYPFYISKEYNVGLSGHPVYKPGRFVFGTNLEGAMHFHQALILAEEPAIMYTEHGFDVELHYLRVRRLIQPARSNDTDPLCRTINTPHSQLIRLCVAVYNSSPYKNRLRYPNASYSYYDYPCAEEEVSLRSAEAIQLAEGKSYYERMALCYSQSLDTRQGEEFIYISRAYKPNVLFVYRRDTANQKIYLENLSINVNVPDNLNVYELGELSAFDHVEY